MSCGIEIENAPATSGGGGDVSGPGSSTDNAVARFDGTGGDTIQDSLVILTDAGALLAADGTESLPSHSFTAATGDGMWWDSALEYLKFSNAGVTQITVTPEQTMFNGSNVMFPDGSPGTIPGITFVADSDTGISRTAANTMAFSTGGTTRLTISTTVITPALPFSVISSSSSVSATTTVSAGTTSSAGTAFRGPSGSAGTPAYSFTGDTDTGMYLSASNTLGFAAGGVLRASLNTTTLSLDSVNIIPSTDNTRSLGSNTLRMAETNQRRLKVYSATTGDTGIVLDVTTAIASTPSGGAIDVAVHTFNQGISLGLYTEASTTGASGNMRIETGSNQDTGTSNSGLVALRTGEITDAGNGGNTGSLNRVTGTTAGVGQSGNINDTTGDVTTGESGSFGRTTGLATGAGNSGTFGDFSGDVEDGNSGGMQRSTGVATGTGATGDITDTTGSADGGGNSGGFARITGAATSTGLSGAIQDITGSTEDGTSGLISRTTGDSTNGTAGNIVDTAGTGVDEASSGAIIQSGRIVDQTGSVRGTIVANLAAAPTAEGPGQLYWNTVLDKLQVYNGTTWETITSV